MILNLLLNTWMTWIIFIKKVEEHNPNRKRKKLMIFDDTIADMLSNKKFNPVVTELLIRRRRLNIFLVFIT